MAINNSLSKTPSVRMAQPKAKAHAPRRRTGTKPPKHGEFDADLIHKYEKSIMLYHVFGVTANRPENQLDTKLFYIAQMIQERGKKEIMSIWLSELDAISELDPKTTGKRQGVPRTPPRPEHGQIGLEEPAESYFLSPTDVEGIHGFLASLQWWIDVSHWMLLGIGMPDNKLTSIALPSRTAHSMVIGILEAYGLALKASPGYGRWDRDIRPVYELLRRYRAYTRFVGKLAHEIWPEIDWQPLEELV